MSNPLHEIDKLFHDSIEGRSEYPPKNVWNNIESELDKETALKYKRKYNSLKRKISILLVLFLGFVLYATLNQYQRKENVLANQQDPAARLQLQPATSDNSAQTEEVTTPVQDANVVLRKSEDLKTDHLPSVTNTLGGEISNTENDLANTEPGKASRTIAIRRKIIAVKQAFNNRIAGSNENFPIVEHATANADEVSDVSYSSGVSSAIENRMTRYTTDPDGRLLSFTITPVDDSWKKDIASNRLKPAVINPVPQLANYTSAKKQNDVNFGISRFSLSLQFSTNDNWNFIKDDESYIRRPNLNGGSGNGAGGNGTGGNGSGGNGGGARQDHNDEDWHEIKKNEYYGIAYSGSIKLNYDINKKISVQSGLNYLKQSIIVRPKKIYAERDYNNNGDVGYRINNSSGYSYIVPKDRTAPNDHDSIVVNDTRNSISYLGLPVSVEYRILSSSKFSLSASAGGQVNFLLKGKTTTVFEKGTNDESHGSGKTQGLKSAYFSILTGLTGEMRLNKKLSLTLAPAGQFGLTYVNKGTSVKTRSNYLGLAAGLKLRL